MSGSIDTLRSAFRDQGFVCLRHFFAARETLGELERVLQACVPQMPREHVFYEDPQDPASLKQLQHLEWHDAWFNRLLTRGPFRELAEQLLGPVVPKNLQYFNKPAMRSRPTPAHQDGFYFMLEPCEALTMWLALDPVCDDSGPVRYVPGSHKRGLRDHRRTDTLGFSQGIPDYPTEQERTSEVAMLAQPGDVLVHHALTIHRADANRSGTLATRRALGLIYYSAQAAEDTEAHARYQTQLAQDLRQQGRI